MKNFTRVLNLAVLTVAMTAFASCSSSPLASTETTDIPVEANAGGEAFNAVANSDLTPTAEPGAVMDSATPAEVVAQASAPETTASYEAPAEKPARHSSANLGASSSGRAH